MHNPPASSLETPLSPTLGLPQQQGSWMGWSWKGEENDLLVGSK